MSLIVPVTPGQLPQGFCPDSYQAIINEFSAHQTVVIADSALGGITVSATTPTDQSKPWLRLDGFGRPVRMYWYAQGAWLSLHPLPPGTTVWWFDTLPTFSAFDGGDNISMTATAFTGPMWQQAKLPNGTAIAAQFPIVAGTLPSGASLALGDTGGEEKHLLTSDEVAPHTHPAPTGTATFATFKEGFVEDNLGNNGLTAIANQQLPGAHPNTGQNTPTGDGVPFNLLPPYAVGYLLQRTDKLFYSVT